MPLILTHRLANRNAFGIRWATITLMPSAKIHPDAPPALSIPSSIPLTVKSGSAARRAYELDARVEGQLRQRLLSEYQAVGKTMRPSLWMRVKVRRPGEEMASQVRQDEQALIQWVNSELKGATISMSATTKAITSGADFGLPGTIDLAFIGKEVWSWFKSEKNSIQRIDKGALLEAGKEMVKEMAEALDCKESVITSVVDNIPFLGYCYNTLKVVDCGASILVTAYYRNKSVQRFEDSISVIEQEALRAVIGLEHRTMALYGYDMAASAAKAATNPFGISGLVGIPLAVAKVVIKIYLLVRLSLKVGEVSERLTAGTLTLEDIRDVPLLGLILPHLKTADTLAKLGVLPPGWRNATTALETNRQLQQLKAALEKEEQGLLKRDLLFCMPSDSYLSRPNVWEKEIKHLQRLYRDTNFYLFEEKWHLYRGEEQIYEPPPITQYQEVKKYAKQKALIVKKFLVDKVAPPLKKLANAAADVDWLELFRLTVSTMPTFNVTSAVYATIQRERTDIVAAYQQVRRELPSGRLEAPAATTPAPTDPPQPPDLVAEALALQSIKSIPHELGMTPDTVETPKIEGEVTVSDPDFELKIAYQSEQLARTPIRINNSTGNWRTAQFVLEDVEDV